MRSAYCVVLIWCVALISLSVAAPAMAAQGRQGRGTPAEGAAAGDQPVTPGEIQRMFDSYALLQAQDQLKITDEQFAQFLPRFRTLLDVRRRALADRMRLVQDLRLLVNAPGQPDEAQMREKVKALSELDTRVADETKRAEDAVDQVLTVYQQAKFRVFEENMERRKLELVTRARQANRRQP